MPSWRLREATERYERQLNERISQLQAQHQAELERVQSQVRALVGVQPPANPEVEGIREQFAQVFPELMELAKLNPAELKSLIEQAQGFRESADHYWGNYGRQMVDRLFGGAEQAIGQPLTDEGRRLLHNAFVGFVQSSPEMMQRYQSDPTLVDDFVRAYTANFIEPSRRMVAATAATRVPTGLPQDTPAGVAPTAPPAKPANLDDAASMAWALYNQRRRG